MIWSMNEWMNDLEHQWISKSMNEWMNEQINEWASEWLNLQLRCAESVENNNMSQIASSAVEEKLCYSMSVDHNSMRVLVWEILTLFRKFGKD